MTLEELKDDESYADIVLDTSGPTKDAIALIRDHTGGYGPHAVIDLVGMPPTFLMGREAMRKGGTQVQVGLFGGNVNNNIGGWPTTHKHLMGNYVGTLDEFNELMELVRSGAKKDIPFETRPISEANAAIADLRAGKIVGRCVLTHTQIKQKL